MANVTLVSGLQPEAVHAGVNALVSKVSLSASGTTSAGDVLFLGKLPVMAIPISAVFYPGAAFNGTTVFKIGTSASAEAFFDSHTYSVSNPWGLGSFTARRLGFGSQVSVSDDAMPRYDNVVMTLATSVLSAGYHGTLVVLYKMPGQSV